MREVVFDFDGTVTQQDTINVLAQFAISSRGSAYSQQEASENWKRIVDPYLADYAKHKELYVPKAEDRKQLAQELAYLESLRTVELSSVERVVNTGFFARLTSEQWEEFGREARRIGEEWNPDWDGDEGKAVRVRKGFSEFVQQAKARGDKLGLVSVNWSRAFVEGVIEPEDPDRSEFVKRVNEIKWPGGQLEGPEEMGGKVMMTAKDKLEGFETMLLKESAGGSKKRESVYFGDSVTDLECLLRADTGIVVVNEGEEEQSTLLGTLTRLGFEVPHVSEGREGIKLAWARDFKEVLGNSILG
ncbi:hypothetical protein NEUTE1DRAFT_126763 [Neurospora tetrasperma FGSC 2508]|uniref:HAD-like protein n=1 Tax=Neurospora tetrasperma (strain FGSC 2508 / ATCC MYA-4615 / P0657) TaxID=510951 RepID=F8N3R3_NEUT8|nr:uncharacterized protein NEUTE1DRAFT_126763 [Neurospora tetrasperma FGSC 2508]EGO53464.1 hypothetical protein NEUTE1DRAFT_126763 [Neurospora tetrasperma FGSC 2508]